MPFPASRNEIGGKLVTQMIEFLIRYFLTMFKWWWEVKKREEYAPFYNSLLEKAKRPARIDWQKFWPQKSQSLSRDLNLAYLDRMPSLSRLRHHLCPQRWLSFLLKPTTYFLPIGSKAKLVQVVTRPRGNFFRGGGGLSHRKRVILFWRIVGTEIGKKSAKISEPIKPEKRSARKCIFPEKLIVTFFASSTAP